MTMHDKDIDLLALLKGKIEIVQEKRKRLFFTVIPEKLREVSELLFREGLRLSTVSAVEGFEEFELLYHFSDDTTGKYYTSKVFIPLVTPEIPSISDIVEGASWIEREIHDLFGISFTGHPDLKPLLKENNEKIPETPLRVKRRGK